MLLAETSLLDGSGQDAALETSNAASDAFFSGGNLQVTDDPGVQQMPSIAVNPLDAAHLVISYMDYSLVDTGYAGIGLAVSRDAGETWTRTSIPVPQDFNEGAANPITRFDD